VDSSSVTFRFYSDGSVNDWGYKATIKVAFPPLLPFRSPPFGYDISEELLCLFENGMPECGDFNLPADEVCERSERVSDDVRKFIKRFLPRIGAARELPPSIGHIHRLLTMRGVSLSDQDISALATTPPRFVPQSRGSEQAVIERAVSVFSRGGGNLPASVERLAKRVSPTRK
jgi:hypothetical protein